MTMTVQTPESDLVARSIAGDREAFADIVGRYQSLVCLSPTTRREISR